MDSQRVPFLSWAHFYQGKGIEELRQALVMTTMELEGTRLKAQEEIKLREDQLYEVKELLNRAIKERDEAHDQYQRLILEKVLIQQNQQQNQQQKVILQLSQNQRKHHQSAPLSGVSSIEDEQIRVDSNNGFSSSDCEESIVSSPVVGTIHHHQKQLQGMSPKLQESVLEEQHQDPTLLMLADRPLPEKGKLLQAVMKAGPLLQTLLLAGPLPQWRHPPPPLDSYQIPPPPVLVPAPTPSPKPTFPAGSLHQESLPISTFPAYNGIINNCGAVNRKRVFSEGSDSSSENKYQRLVFQ